MQENCQICLTQDPEDIALIYEMLSLVLQSYFETNSSISAQVFTYIFRHLQFRKSLALVFDTKYKEINELCTHQILHKIYLSLWSNNIGHQDQIGRSLLEAGVVNLYNQVVDKQEKLKQSKEQFDSLAQQLFSNDDEINHESQQPDSEDSDQQKPMQFNKNSNKNKFQKRSIDILKKWFIEHLDNPYPDQSEKFGLSQLTGMHVRQIQNWFTNSRKRYLEPLKKKLEAGTISTKKFQSNPAHQTQKQITPKQEYPQSPNDLINTNIGTINLPDKEENQIISINSNKGFQDIAKIESAHLTNLKNNCVNIHNSSIALPISQNNMVNINQQANLPYLGNQPQMGNMINMPNIQNMMNLPHLPQMINMPNVNNLGQMNFMPNQSNLPNYMSNSNLMSPIQQQMYMWTMNEWQNSMQQMMQFQMMQQHMPYFFAPPNNDQRVKE